MFVVVWADANRCVGNVGRRSVAPATRAANGTSDYKNEGNIRVGSLGSVSTPLDSLMIRSLLPSYGSGVWIVVATRGFSM